MDTLRYIADKYGVDVTQRVIHLPDVGRNDLASLFGELKFSFGAEIGVLLGNYSEELCKRNPGLALASIDPYLVFNEYHDLTTQADWDNNYIKTVQKLSKYTCTVIREKSMDAVKNCKNESLDFVYIDGNHEFTSEANDIHEWSKKVRPGGIIAGHDYIKYKERSYSHSYEVVNAYTDAYRIRPLFIIGKNVDKIRSWFWVKQ